MTRLVLPWPPSANTYYRHVPCGRASRTIMSAQGRRYRSEVASLLREARGLCGEARISVTVYAYGPTRRKYDLDNRLKPLLDALEGAGVMDDDEQVDDLRIVRCGVVKGGRVVVEIRDISESGE